MNFKELTGRSNTHLISIEGNQLLHSETVSDFLQLKSHMHKKGIDIKIASGFRSYERQRTIWNEKAEGKRTLRDPQGNPLNYHELNCDEIFQAILNWSSIPGTSRHHWGTDLDVYDYTYYQNGRRLRLANDEYSGNGPNAKLSAQLYDEESLYFRPYLDGKSYQVELWHISNTKISEKILKLYTIDVFKKSIESDPLLKLKDKVLARLEPLYNKYIALNGAN